MDIGISVRVPLPFDEAVERTRTALKEQGFGVLTEIDVRQTLRDKIGEDTERYLILGACNPRLAHRALEVDRRIGLLLPCNVVVRESEDGTLVEALDPEIMVQATEEPGFAPVAAEAAARLRTALDTLDS
ncbi:DUF302 domain-containing protein [Amycolatopsis dongchuanensis]|uniref:DUF302 domain-containing protein n=1 Tax=Amycolatopsis dongchuanensis TaxID=1070866 RepID=A0ABP9Q254_9PSEU